MIFSDQKPLRGGWVKLEMQIWILGAKLITTGKALLLVIAATTDEREEGSFGIAEIDLVATATNPVR